jgi:SAM-dependent methyltransferase
VRAKYDGQATFYSAGSGPALEPGLLQRIEAEVSPGAELLVAGSGSGRESFALVEAGYRVTGVDFAPAMVAHARAAAAERRLDVLFHEADLRSLDLGPARFSAVVFTYDVYSFLPSRAERADVLARIARSLAPGGVVYLSARLVRSVWARVILTLACLRGHTRPREWGATHTRYVASDGSLHRSFVRHFTQAQLARELAAAGFELIAWEGGHGACRRRA